MKDTAKDKKMRVGEWCTAIGMHVLLVMLAVGLMALSACMVGVSAVGIGVGRLRS